MSTHVIIRRAVALLAAYLVALQGLLGVFMIFAHVAEAAAAPDFVICSSNGSPQGDHNGLPTPHNNLCFAFCTALGNGATGPLIDQPRLQTPSHDVGQSILFPIKIGTTARALGASAYRSRAPPLV